ncbi:MAG TPA: DUF4398 domain-containing protein [Rhodanobacter sp.]
MYIFSQLARSPERVRTALVVLLLGLALAGCASVPPPDDSMNLAQSQLQMALDAGAADYAPVDLGFAQDKFQQAQTAMAGRKYADAANLAEESRADAELAQAKARLGAARAQIRSKLDENTRLRQQSEQAAAPAPSVPAPSTLPPPPTEDMPAPASSALSMPPADGFQTVPDAAQQPAARSQGDQP